MALTAARNVEANAQANLREAGAGRGSAWASQVAGAGACMAIISIAEDVHRIADHLLGLKREEDFND
jgi:hypothetical protein